MLPGAAPGSAIRLSEAGVSRGTSDLGFDGQEGETQRGEIHTIEVHPKGVLSPRNRLARTHLLDTAVSSETTGVSG